MNLFIVKNYQDVSALGADFVIKQIIQKPNSVLGLATGSTPIGLYQALILANYKKKISFKDIKTFNLDEYIGLDKNNPQSFYFFMAENLFSKIDIKKDNINLPNGMVAPKEIKNYCLEYENKIKKSGGIDLQILGIGSNGHIGFNEPGSKFNSVTRSIKLTKQTIKDNSRFFKNPNEVPKEAITMGLKTIFQAKKIILLATGQNKSLAIKKLFIDKPNLNFPASILKNHPNVTIIIDQQAAQKIEKFL